MDMESILSLNRRIIIQKQIQVKILLRFRMNHFFSSKDKLIYVANYDFNGTSATGELSFRKNDRLEILDRYS